MPSRSSGSAMLLRRVERRRLGELSDARNERGGDDPIETTPRTTIREKRRRRETAFGAWGYQPLAVAASARSGHRPTRYRSPRPTSVAEVRSARAC